MDRFFTLFCIIVALAFAVGAYAFVSGHLSIWRGIGFTVCLVGVIVYATLARLCSYDSTMGKPSDCSHSAC